MKKISIPMMDEDVKKLKNILRSMKMTHFINMIISKRIKDKDFKLVKVESGQNIISAYVDEDKYEALKTIATGNNMRVIDVIRCYIISEINESLLIDNTIKEDTDAVVIDIPKSYNKKIREIASKNYVTKKKMTELIFSRGMIISENYRDIEIIAIVNNVTVEEYIQELINEDITKKVKVIKNLIEAEKLLLNMSDDDRVKYLTDMYKKMVST